MKFLIPLLKILLVVPVLAINTDDEQDENQPPEENHPQILDISSEQRAELTYSEKKILDSLEYEQLNARYNIPITKVVDGQQEIWENPERPFRTMGMVYDSGQPELLFIEETGPGTKVYFERQHDTWVNVPQEHYLALVKTLVDQVPISSHFALNLRFLTENEKYKIEVFPKKHVNLVIYTPTMHHRIRAVHDDDNVMWTASSNSERCVTIISYNKGEVPLLVDLIIVSDFEPMKHIYLVPEDEEWVQVEEGDYIQRILKLKYDNENVLPITLDIDDVDKILFEVKVRTFETPYFKYIPKGFMRITKVVDGDDTIWESDNENEFFAYSAGFTDQEGCPMLFLNVNQGTPSYNLVFVQRPTGWEPASPLDLDDRIGEVQQARYTIMDLSDIDEDRINILSLTMGNVNYVLFTSKVSYDIMVIKDGDQFLWNYGGLEAYLSNGWLYFHKDEPKLFHFRVREPILGHEDYYYIKRDGTWERIPKEEYVKILNEMTYSTKQTLPETEDDDQSSLGTMKTEDLETPETAEAPTEPTETSDVDSLKDKIYAEYGKPDYKPEEDLSGSKVLHYVPDKELPHPDKTTGPRKPRVYEFDDKKDGDSKDEDRGKPHKPRKEKTVTFEHIDPKDVEKYLDETPTRSYYHHKSMEDLRTSHHDEFYPRHRKPIRKSKSSPDVSHKKKHYETESEDDDDQDATETTPLLKKKPKLKKRLSKKVKKPSSALVPTLGLVLATAIFTAIF